MGKKIKDRGRGLQKICYIFASNFLTSFTATADAFLLNTSFTCSCAAFPLYQMMAMFFVGR